MIPGGWKCQREVINIQYDPDSRNCIKRHMKIQTKENLYVCDMFGKGFITRIHLKKHMKSHAIDNPYLCDQCINEFSSRNHLKRHMKSHGMDDPYPCALFVEEIISRNHPKRHIHSHTWKIHINVLSVENGSSPRTK